MNKLDDKASTLNKKVSIPRKILRVLFQGYRYCTSPFRTLPNFFIIGAQRCGTTSLYSYLQGHPRVSSGLKKEISFFDKRYQKGLLWYRSQFPSFFFCKKLAGSQKAQIRLGDATPEYLFHPHAAQRIFSNMPDAKIIVMLRNPVDRAYSHYQHSVRFKFETLPFEKAIDQEEKRLEGEREKMLKNEISNSVTYEKFSYLRRGIYVDQLKVWMNQFPREQFLIIKSEDFYQNTPERFGEVLSFLGLNDWTPAHFKQYAHKEYSNMNKNLKERLYNYFEPHNRKLYESLGRDFGWESQQSL